MAHRVDGRDDSLLREHLRQFTIDAMREEGVEPDTVETAHWNDDVFNEKYAVKVTKCVNGEIEERQFAIAQSPLFVDDIDILQQEIAMVARDVACEIKSEMIDTIEVSNTRINFCSAEGGWVECSRCNERVSLSDLTQSLGFAMEAELSNPAPTPYNIEEFLRRLDSGEREVLKLYMLGALRKHCLCEFGKMDYRHY